MNHAGDNRFGTMEVIHKIGISSERLRYWEQVGIVHPEYVQCGTRRFRRYSQEDINRGLYVKILVDGEKYTLAGAVRKLENENNGGK